MSYRKEINPVYYQVGKRTRITGYLGEIFDGDQSIHDKEYKTYHAAEVALDKLVFDLMRSNPQAEAEPASTCCFCSKPHHPQSCPEMRAMLFAPDAPVICSLPDNMCDVHKPCAAHAADAARYLASEDMRAARCATCGGEGYCPDCGTLFMSAPLDLDFAPIGPEV